MCVTCHEKVTRRDYKTSESEDTGDGSNQEQKRATKKRGGKEKVEERQRIEMTIVDTRRAREMTTDDITGDREDAGAKSDPQQKSAHGSPPKNTKEHDKQLKTKTKPPKKELRPQSPTMITSVRTRSQSKKKTVKGTKK